MISQAEIERVMQENLGADPLETFRAHGYDPDAVGTVCGLLARSALEPIKPNLAESLYNQIGANVTTAALAAFEAALLTRGE